MSKSSTLRIIAVESTKQLIRSIHKCPQSRSEIDTLDEFTTQLLRKKLDKWEFLRTKKNIKLGSSNVNNMTNKLFNKKMCIYGYSSEQVDELVNQMVLVRDIETLVEIIKQCKEYDISPSFSVIEEAIMYLSLNGHCEGFQLLINLASKYSEFYTNAKFKHYVAEYIWLRGNMDESLKIFEEVYNQNNYLRRKVKLMLRHLIGNIITQRSEAALVKIVNFTEMLVRKYHDYFLLAVVWQSCFMSEWFADQCVASNLLEKHEGLRGAIVLRLPYVIQHAIRENQPETLHRLFEVLLKYEMKSQYVKVLQSLFHYRYRNNDLRSCVEIIQWSLKLDIPLLSTQHEQFLNLLLGNTSSKSNDSQTEDQPKKPQTSHFQLKF